MRNHELTTVLSGETLFATHAGTFSHCYEAIRRSNYGKEGCYGKEGKEGKEGYYGYYGCYGWVFLMNIWSHFKSRLVHHDCYLVLLVLRNCHQVRILIVGQRRLPMKRERDFYDLIILLSSDCNRTVIEL